MINEEIEALYKQIIDLQMRRSRAARYNNWPEEQRIDEEIIKLEEQIKSKRSA